MRIELTTRFNRELDRLLTKQPMILSRVEKTLELLSSDPRHPSLRLHKLSGKNTFAAAVNFHGLTAMVLFRFVRLRRIF